MRTLYTEERVQDAFHHPKRRGCSGSNLPTHRIPPAPADRIHDLLDPSPARLLARRPSILQLFDLVGEGHYSVASIRLGQDHHAYLPQHRVGAGDAPVTGVDSYPVQVPALVLDHPLIPGDVAVE